MSLLKRLFGKGKPASDAEQIVKDTLEGVLHRAGLDLEYEVHPAEAEGNIRVEMYGQDEELLRDREGQLLDALQFFMKRVVQHQLPESRIEVDFDSNGYREESSQALLDLAEKLKAVVIEKNRSVYFRALPPKDRKVIHQYLAADTRVKSRSIGEGLYKKIKIFPAGQDSRGRSRRDRNEEEPTSQEVAES
jgi:spoIIIJ-associated protein